MKIVSFISANCDLLRQLSEVLGRIDCDNYGLHHDKIFDSSVGGHVRHILDHYENFVTALFGSYPIEATDTELAFCDRPMVNYDRRLREREIELNPAVADARIAQMIEILEVKMPRSDIELDIILQIDLAPDTALQSSTLARELSFLYSHTVHHMAILSYIFKATEVEGLPHDFGIAPSTISFRRAM